MSDLYDNYNNKIKKDLVKILNLKNINEVPVIEQISVNMGVGKFKDNKEYLEEAKNDMSNITGLIPSNKLAKKAISGFKLRENDLIGYTVTLRGIRAWDFLEKLIRIVLPRVRDFKGLSRKSFDKNGNYSFGIREHFVFPEINPDKVKHIKSLQVNIKTSTNIDKSAEKMLEGIGFPFTK
ncbi:50S ribosomal protein L5 [candidate division WWE3 bacterium CG10_big_fil_rev_8_21_14_0_10_32_10]|uniref:Large ribosomal subunit protein uL5 n=1 Tax=candidate division WWE3 bacterium CG10_big_fil_rev_8_21_14_0_10_32_10 TaxID=1975090 RepID=A0A2H0RAY6_UNCKA|nr:MAG: 50S ribosomal protein L5 [candidate division WWE3 bacterium CG10_big_fil_rev_8_21_14_0_10_32_10]